VIKTLAKHTWLRVAGLAAGAAVVSGAAVLVTASAAGYNLPFLKTASPAPPTSAASLNPQAAQASAACADFIAHFSADLKTTETALNAAFQKAIGETLADQVKSGKLTQAQSDAIAKRLAGKAPCAIAGSLKAGATLGAFRQALLTASASALGITDATLKADLRTGMTLSQIAAAQKPAVTEAQFRARLIANLTPVLDKAVTAKRLTPAQEKAILTRLQTGPIPFWNKPMKTAKPAATPTPASTNS
jgi:hypothetical protein